MIRPRLAQPELKNAIAFFTCLISDEIRQIEELMLFSSLLFPSGTAVSPHGGRGAVTM
jgi:hypothetical protein